LREKYPKISLALFTNGSLVKKEMVDFAKKVSLHFIVSHDGPTFNEDRAKDPFDIPSQAEGLHYLFNTLNPLGLISFNATVSPKNYSITKIRDYIANKLGVDSKKIIVTNDLATPYDSEGLSYVTQPEKRRELVNNLFQEFKSLFPFNMKLGMTDQVMHDFYESIRNF
jgi:MoaA/NifB/PqqE/SkfB family radical SAM enzyme